MILVLTVSREIRRWSGRQERGDNRCGNSGQFRPHRYTVAVFTGLVQTRGHVTSVQFYSFGMKLVIDPREWAFANQCLRHGDSVCVNGVCLTLVQKDSAGLHFDIISETLAKTTLSSLAVGSEVNLESSLTPTSQIGGHFLQGHVDGVGIVREVIDCSSERRLIIVPPVELMDYIAIKGSIAIDGVSLTIAAVAADSFEVALIPTTLEITTLGSVKPDARVNLEADTIAKTVVNYLRRQSAMPSSIPKA